MIESLTNLDKIENGKYIVFILPLAMEGLEASPLRVIAIRKEDLHELSTR
jgi:arylformamidase